MLRYPLSKRLQVFPVRNEICQIKFGVPGQAHSKCTTKLWREHRENRENPSITKNVKHHPIHIPSPMQMQVSGENEDEFWLGRGYRVHEDQECGYVSTAPPSSSEYRNDIRSRFVSICSYSVLSDDTIGPTSKDILQPKRLNYSIIFFQYWMSHSPNARGGWPIVWVRFSFQKLKS
jgi:hypothetical protein